MGQNLYKNLPGKHLRFVKVFGERNTGTNFLNQLLKQNTSLKVLEHKSNSDAKIRLRKLIDSHSKSNKRAIDPSLRQLIFDRLIDQQRQEEYPKNYGWKHARVVANDLAQSKRFNSTLFIFLIRNPWRFVSALHKRPYNLFPSPPENFIDFVNSCFLANPRDCLPCNFVENPVEFWNQKVRSYQDCNTSINSSLICYYEDIVNSPKKFIHSLNPVCSVIDEIIIPMDSTKKDDKSFDDYRREALSYNPVKALGEEAYTHVLDKLDKNVLNKTIYSKG